MNLELQELLNSVEQATGYTVSVTTKEISTHASFVSATPERPVHAVFINPKYAQWGDYLLAMQCSMILIKWKDITRIPDFSPDPQIVNNQIRNISGKMENIPAPAAQKFSSMLISGLLQQLNSIPIQMMAVEICRDRCPSLHRQQNESIQNELREMTSVLDKKIQSTTPQEIFERCVAMNAAYSYHWAEVSGDASITLSYQAAGFCAKGKELLGAYKTIDPKSVTRYQETVDSWAGYLNLNGWYTWRYRSNR